MIVLTKIFLRLGPLHYLPLDEMHTRWETLRTPPQNCDEERMWRHGVEPIWGHTFQTEREGKAYERIIAGVDCHFVPKMLDVLVWVAHSGVVVEGWSRELPRKLALQDLFGERTGVFGSWKYWSFIELQLSLLDLSSDQLIEDSDVERFFNFRPAFRLRWYLDILKGSDLSVELFIELF